MDLTAVNVLLSAVKPLVAVVEDTDALLRRKLGTAFRYADYAIGGYEVPLNRLLCDLLDPRGPHGQGGSFLELFLKTLQPDFLMNDPTRWKAKHNFLTNHGRLIDIVLLGPDSTAVGIESKPWAEESDSQLEDYAAYLLERFGAERAWFAYLPGHAERSPETLTPETKIKLGTHFVILPFQRTGTGRSVVEWLEKCAVICQADKVTRFLRDLIEYLDSEFSASGKEQYMSDNPGLLAIGQLIGANAEHIKSAFDIELAMPELRRGVAKGFIDKIKNDLTREGWTVENTFANFSESSNKEHLTYRRLGWPQGWGICLGQWSPMHGLYIGLYCPGKEPALTGKNVTDILSAMGPTLLAVNKQQSQKEWPAFTDLPEPFNDWRRSDTIALLKGLKPCDDGRTADAIFVTWFRDLAAAAEPILESILSGKA